MPLDGLHTTELLDDVEATRRLIERGWIQARSWDGRDFCLYGALREVTNGWDNNPRYRRLHDFVLAHVTPSISLSGWNDTPGRTQADVLALLDECKADAA